MKVRFKIKRVCLAMAIKNIDSAYLAKEIGVSQQEVEEALRNGVLMENKVISGICKALNLKAKDVVIIED